MNYFVIIPAHNEAQYIAQTLDSLVAQTVLPSQVVVVDDQSTDETAEIVAVYAQKYSWISLVRHTSAAVHLPGSKVIQAFNQGLILWDYSHDCIVKLDADLILPTNYFEKVLLHFQSDAKIGMVGGVALIPRNGQWVLEQLTDKDHIRGAFKAYRKECFQEIGGLRPAMGWDTVDELLSHFYNWKILVDPSLQVKHLKPTGARYNKAARYKQGEAFYALGYGFWITLIASLKLAMMKRKPLLSIDYVLGFWKAKWSKTPLLVNTEQAKFIRNYRWQKMKAKLKA